MIDPSIQRLNMVESQIRPSDITDQRILRAMGSINREDFLPLERKALAYLDSDQPLAFPEQNTSPQRYLLAPRTLAKLLQLAHVEPTNRVLDVGCATGYTAAVLSRFSLSVIALESDRVLAQEATHILHSQGVDNVSVVEGTLPRGYPEKAPYDVIFLEGAISEMPKNLFDQLKDGGRLVAILKDGYGGRAYQWLRTGEIVSPHPDFDVPHAFILPGFEPSRRFDF